MAGNPTETVKNLNAWASIASWLLTVLGLNDWLVAVRTLALWSVSASTTAFVSTVPWWVYVPAGLLVAVLIAEVLRELRARREIRSANRGASSELEREIIGLLMDGREMQIPKIASALNVSEKELRPALASLFESNTIEQTYSVYHGIRLVPTYKKQQNPVG